jgi:hypothetical protein
VGEQHGLHDAVSWQPQPVTSWHPQSAAGGCSMIMELVSAGTVASSTASVARGATG